MKYHGTMSVRPGRAAVLSGTGAGPFPPIVAIHLGALRLMVLSKLLAASLSKQTNMYSPNIYDVIPQDNRFPSFRHGGLETSGTKITHCLFLVSLYRCENLKI
jgi:hypothetical protein